MNFGGQEMSRKSRTCFLESFLQVSYQSGTRWNCNEHLRGWEKVKEEELWTNNHRQIYFQKQQGEKQSWEEVLRGCYKQSKEQEGNQHIDLGTKVRPFGEVENLHWVWPFWWSLDISQVRNTVMSVGTGKYLAYELYRVLSSTKLFVKSQQTSSSPQHQDNILRHLWHFL